MLTKLHSDDSVITKTTPEPDVGSTKSNRDDLFIQRASDNYKSSATACKLRDISERCNQYLERNIQHPVVCLVVNATTDEFIRLMKGKS